MFNYAKSDIYTEEELESMSINEKRERAKLKAAYGIKWTMINAEAQPECYKNLDNPDEDYVYDYYKTCDEDCLDHFLMKKWDDFYDDALSI